LVLLSARLIADWLRHSEGNDLVSSQHFRRLRLDCPTQSLRLPFRVLQQVIRPSV